jgi:tetratricopeptide (TPR) repeat protein
MDENGRWSDDAKNMLSGMSDSDTLIPKLIDEAEEIPQKEPPINTDEKAPTVPDEKKEETTPKQPESTGETKPTVKPPEKIKPEKKEIKKEPETKEPEKTSDLSAIIKDGFKAIEKNDLKTAEKKFKEALKIDNNSYDACQGIAKVYFLSRQSSDEKKYVKQMVKSRGANPNDNFEMAKGFEKIGDNISAIEHYRNYLASNPFGAHAEEVKKRLTELDKLSTGG